MKTWRTSQFHPLALSSLLFFSLAGTLKAQAAPAPLLETRLYQIYESCIRDQMGPVYLAAFGGPAEVRDVWYENRVHSKPLIGRERLVIIGGYGPDMNCTGYPESELTAEFGLRIGILSLDAHVNSHVCLVEAATRHSTETRVKLAPIWIPYYQYETEHQNTVTADRLGRVERTNSVVVRPGSLKLMGFAKNPNLLPWLNRESGLPILNSKNEGIAFDTSAYTACLRGAVSKYSE